jgi:LAO/AO transport system kinase
MDAIARHQDWLTQTERKRDKERARAEMQFVALLRERLLRQALERLKREKGRLEEVASRIADRQADPYALADELASQLEE